MNIFNGVEAGLQEYDASSNLWVSLSSNAYLKPVPFYADLTANVNGDASGPIDFAFWWDCDSLEADPSLVAGVCGSLPVPPAGECAKDDVGQQCLGVTNELQLAEYTYREIGNQTPKVIVERGSEAPVEDRYKITTYNPIQLLTLNPTSPASGDVGSVFTLTGTAGIHTTVAGVFQISLDDPVTGEVLDFDCSTVNHDDQATKNYSLSLTGSESGEVVYQISRRYRIAGTCPIVDQHAHDLDQLYVVSWTDDNPRLEITDELGNPLLSGTTIDLGELEPFQTIILEFEITNPSQTQDFNVSSVVFQNLENVTDLLVTPGIPYTVEPGETIPVSLSLDILTTGPLSFDIAIEHNAINPSPFNLTIEGTARLSSNPLQSISTNPATPGAGQIDDPYQLQIELDLDAPASGVVGVSLLDTNGDTISADLCLEVLEAGLDTYLFEYSILEVDPGLQGYTIWARYRPLGTCSIADVQADDLSQAYQIEWLEDNPALELQDSEFNAIDNGGFVDLGDQAAFQLMVRNYLIVNSSDSSSIEVSGIQFGNLVNVFGPQVDLQGPFTVNPGEQKNITISFEIEAMGAFSLLASLDHTGSNHSPFTFSMQGTGILSENPIQSISTVPVSPGENLIGDSHTVEVDVSLTPPASGALKVRLVDQEENVLDESECLEIAGADPIIKTADLSWVETTAGNKDYTIQAYYYVGEDCQQGETSTSEFSVSYQVEWQEENPVLEIVDLDGNLMPAGGTHILGQFEYDQTVTFEYKLHNTSRTNTLTILGLDVDNLSNLSQVTLSPSGEVQIGPDESIGLEISFLVDNTGNFSFDIVIDHQASNPTPYQLSFQGSGVMSANPIKFVVPLPASPGSSLIGTPFSLRVDVGIDAPETGSLQVSVIEEGTNLISDKVCLVLNNNLNQARTFNLNWTRSVPGTREYTILTQYRSQANCPIAGSSEDDLSQTYKVNWQEDQPVLEIRDQAGVLTSQGQSIELGQKQFYQEVELVFTVFNTSTTSDLQLSSVEIENLVNLHQVNTNLSGPITLGPEDQRELIVSFLVSKQGLFGFDLEINHDATNPSPFRIGFTGNGVLLNNPIVSLGSEPQSPGSSLVNETYQIQVVSELNPPAPGVLELSLEDQNSELVADPVCLTVSEGDLSVQSAEFSWEETSSGSHDYLIRAKYQAGTGCPLVGTPDAELTEPYQVKWQVLSPVLIVNRPEGVTIFDGTVDYVGVHDFFRFVEVTYVIKNDTDATPLVVENILIENIENLREVLIDPALPFEVAPGESQVVKFNFQVLMLEPFSFDLVWEHNGSNPSPYLTGIQGDAKLNLGDMPLESWLYRFINYIIRSGFFLKLPIFGIFLYFRRKKRK